MIRVSKIDEEVTNEYLETISNIYPIYNPYISTGVIKSKVANFISHLKKENLIDGLESIDKGFSISIEDKNKSAAFYLFIRKFIRGMDWAESDNNYILYYAFE